MQQGRQPRLVGASASQPTVSTSEHLTWECSFGHQWRATLNHVKYSGSWCPKCAKTSQKLGIIDAHSLALSRKGACLSTEYINSSTPMLWRCQAGHSWAAQLRSVRCLGSWCPMCNGKRGEQHVRDLFRPPVLAGISRIGHACSGKLTSATEKAQ